jgi:holin-like protein
LGLCLYHSKFLHLPIASGVLGFFILLFWLETQWIRLEQVEHGANLLLTELLLFLFRLWLGLFNISNYLLLVDGKLSS